MASKRCLRCGAADAVHWALCPQPSIYKDGSGKECPHGPFCGTCAARKEEQTLPLCECRALITGWDPKPPPLVRVRPKAPPSLPEPVTGASAPSSFSAGHAHPSPLAGSSPRGASSTQQPRMAPLQPELGEVLQESQPRAALLADRSSEDYSEAEMTAVLQRALRAVDSMMARVPGGKAAEGLAPPGPAAAKAVPSPPPRSVSGLSAGDTNSRSLAEALQLRGGRPRGPKAPGGATFMSRLANFSLWSDACGAVFSALGCSGAATTAEQVEFTSEAVQCERQKLEARDCLWSESHPRAAGGPSNWARGGG